MATASPAAIARRVLQAIEASPNSAALKTELLEFGSAAMSGRAPRMSPMLHQTAALAAGIPSLAGVGGIAAATLTGAQRRHQSTAISRFNEFWGKKTAVGGGAGGPAPGGLEGLKQLERDANAAPDNVQTQGRYLDELHKSGFGAEVVNRIESGRFGVSWSILEMYAKVLEEAGRLPPNTGGAGGARQRLAELWANTDKKGTGASMAAFVQPMAVKMAVYAGQIPAAPMAAPTAAAPLAGAPAGGAAFPAYGAPQAAPTYGAYVAPGAAYAAPVYGQQAGYGYQQQYQQQQGAYGGQQQQGYAGGNAGGAGFGYQNAYAAPGAAPGMGMGMGLGQAAGAPFASYPGASFNPFASAGGAGAGAGGIPPIGGATGAGFPGTKTNPVVVEMQQGKSSMWLAALRATLTIAFLIFLWQTMSRNMPGGALASITGDIAEEVTDVPTVRFADVKGVDEAKGELQDVVAFLRDPERFKRLGAKVPRGVLLTGPPGTGKTLLARAVAGEAGCRFYSKSASEFEEMLVGLGAKRVRDLFAAARKNAPAIIFIDEIDALGGKRRVNIGTGSERQTLNQLLSCMDGFTKNENVIIIAATNSPDILDPALVRPGRFDSTVDVPLPDVRGRKDIIELYLSKVIVGQNIDSELLAKATPGFSGAQLEALVNSAALMAANRGSDAIEMQDIEEARDKLIMGPAKKSRVRKQDQMRLTAYHEGGHTLAAILTRGTNPLHKVTILPRGFSGGATYSLPRDDELMTKESILAQIDVAMGGRAAEELIYGPDKITVGAGMDMQQASDLARKFVMAFSMSSLGLTSFNGAEPSADKKAAIDDEVERILQASYKRVYELLSNQRLKLDRLAGALLEHETLSADEVALVIEGKALPSLREKLSNLQAAGKGSGNSSSRSRGGSKGGSSGSGHREEGDGGEGGAGSSSGNSSSKGKRGMWHTVLPGLPELSGSSTAPADASSVDRQADQGEAGSGSSSRPGRGLIGALLGGAGLMAKRASSAASSAAASGAGPMPMPHLHEREEEGEGEGEGQQDSSAGRRRAEQ